MPEILPDFSQIWIFPTDFSKRPQYQILQESVQWGRADTHERRDR